MVSTFGLIGWKPFIKKFLMSKTNPQHYRQGSIEPWDFIVSQDLNFLEGNIIKYVTRAGKKDGESRLDDLTKAATYLRKLIETASQDESTSPRPDGSSDQVPQADGTTHWCIQSRYSDDSAEIDFGGVRGSYGGTC